MGLPKVLAFDIWGDYGHFRKFYTTTSPLTFSLPAPSTVAGILGAIYGTDKSKNTHLDTFGYHRCKIALRIINPTKKIRLGLNLLETKGSNLRLPMSAKSAPRTQIRTEFLKDPHFRVYLMHNDSDVFKRLSDSLREHKSVFTVSLGLSELLADFAYIDTFEAEPITSAEPCEIVTAFTSDKLIRGSLQIEPQKRYFKEKLPLEMTTSRVVKRYDDVVFEPDGKGIVASLSNAVILSNGEIISFL